LDIKLSDRVKAVKPSATLVVTAQARALKAAGKDIIALGVGEPDFDTPEHVKQAAVQAIHDGFTKYTAVDGIASLKQAIIDKFKKDNGLDYTPEQILVSCGGKQSFYNLAQALLNPGDEVIIPVPYWVSYPDMVLLAAGKPVFIETDLSREFKITPEQLQATITSRTRLLVINSPSNPSGIAYTRAELTALGDVLAQHPDILVASDDMYEHILWANESFANILNVCPELYPRTIVLNGVSKAYSMTGWRIGYAGGPAKLITAMKKIQSHSTSNPASISQVAAQAALKGDKKCIDDMVKAFKERHDFIVAALNRIRGFQCLPSQGAFYAFPCVQDAINSLAGVENDIQFTEYLLEKAGVAVVPGSAFGAPGYIRLSFATSMEQLRQAAYRMSQIIR